MEPIKCQLLHCNLWVCVKYFKRYTIHPTSSDAVECVIAFACRDTSSIIPDHDTLYSGLAILKSIRIHFVNIALCVDMELNEYLLNLWLQTLAIIFLQTCCWSDHSYLQNTLHWYQTVIFRNQDITMIIMEKSKYHKPV